MARAAPLLHEATRHVAHLPIRTRGTVGGSIANADPAAEDPAVAAALGATMVCRSRRGERRIAAAGFFVDVLTTALEPDEMLIAVEIPKIPDGAGAAFAEISRRDGDFALAGVAAQIALSDGRVSDARISACGVGPAPVRFREAEEILLDGACEKAAIEAAARGRRYRLRPARRRACERGLSPPARRSDGPARAGHVRMPGREAAHERRDDA